MEKITIRAFNSENDRESTVCYAIEHARVLDDIGVYQALCPDYSWCMRSGSVVIVAMHEGLGMIGGVRLQLAKLGNPLPIENSPILSDPRLRTTMSLLQPFGNAEICGLWNAQRFAGRGVPMLLTTAAISLAARLGVRSVVSISATYSMDYLISCGFSPMENVGEDGGFDFPIPSIRSFAMINTDLISLGAAELKQRQRLISLRLQPVQTCVENPKRVPLRVEYELLIDDNSIDRSQYEGVTSARLRMSA